MKKIEKTATKSSSNKVTYFERKFKSLLLTENEFKNHFINYTHGCLCSKKLDSYDMRMFLL
jgi:hypothetical protein